MRSKTIEKIKKILKNRYLGEAYGAVMLIATLILSILALSIGPAFIQEHAVVIIILLVVILVISGAAA